MNIAKALREFNEGRRNIERAIIDGVLRKFGKNIDPSHDLTWRPGEFREPPETIVLRVRKAARIAASSVPKVLPRNSSQRLLS